MKTISLGGVDFECIKSRMHPVAPIRYCKWDDIYNYYDRPSVYKVDIWHYWCTWCDKMNELGFECGIEISGANSMQFSITGSLYDPFTNKHYDLWITKAHNRIYEH